MAKYLGKRIFLPAINVIYRHHHHVFPDETPAGDAVD